MAKVELNQPVEKLYLLTYDHVEHGRYIIDLKTEEVYAVVYNHENENRPAATRYRSGTTRTFGHSGGTPTTNSTRHTER